MKEKKQGFLVKIIEDKKSSTIFTLPVVEFVFAGYNGLLAECTELLRQQEEILYPDNVLYVATLDQAVDACINLSQWQEAVEYITKTMHAYR